MAPKPTVATRQVIVAEIETEQALVAANSTLVVRFEKKIQATLARVWGEDEKTAVAVGSGTRNNGFKAASGARATP